MRNKHNETPREAALGAAMEAIRLEWFLQKKGSVSFDGTPRFNKLALNQLAKIYNEMLENSGFDGMLLPEGAKEKPKK